MTLPARRLALLWCLVVLAVPAPNAAQGLTEEAHELLAAGSAALDRQRPAEAQELFYAGFKAATRALDAAREAGQEPDNEALALRDRLQFNLALTHQTMGEREDDRDQLSRALRYYKDLLTRRPASGSTMVNLALVEELLGDRRTAEALFRQAIRLDDKKRTLYEEKYADFLARGESAERQAIGVYRGLLERQPDNPKAQRQVLDYFSDPARGGTELPSVLWSLVRGGEVLTAQQQAFAALEQPGWPPAAREELLGIVAATLGRQFKRPRDVVDSEAGERLARLEDDPQLAQAASELLRLYREPGVYPPGSFEWWGRDQGVWLDSQRGLLARDGFRQAMRSVGGWYEARADFAVAEACYEQAARLAGDELDPRSLRSLADLYIRQKRVDKVQELAVKYEVQLIDAKNEAYRLKQTERIYEYHRTLGGIYGDIARKTGEWDNGTVTSAIFQLQRAKDYGEILDNSSAGRRLHVDPGLVNLLADGYLATQRAAESTALRLSAAETYRQRGDDRSRALVLRPIAVENLDADARSRYESLKVDPSRLRRLEDNRAGTLERRDGG